MKHTNSTIDKLQNIHVPALKGLMALKLMQAQEQDVSMYI